MPEFGFNSVGSVLIEDGAASRLGEILKARFELENIMLVTDKCLVDLGLVEPVVKSLETAGIPVIVFDEVEADPSEATVKKAALKAKSFGVDGVIGFGGGSPMDVAKLVSVLVKGEQELSEMYGVDQVRVCKVPLIQIPTTAGTGSEVTSVSIITTGENTKMGVVSSRIMADLAVLDATLTCGLPAHITAATGIDAMVHAIEAYTTAIKKNPMSDALAKEALQLLGGNIVEACKNGNNVDARRAMLTGAMMAGVSFANAPVGAVHALAYPLGGQFHIPHGLSNSLVLPHVLKFNTPKADHLYAELADVVGLAGVTNMQKTIEFIKWLDDIAEAVGIERRLRDVRIPESAIEGLAEDAMKQTRLLVNNPREVTLSDARAIYEAAW
ncbi:iron-containing alcohol dehydrogenase [Kordiimonas laminariae]|uniref:iron-containing alcohol dehydrogenase n=1 Tax=Kordiimonas laminariae TaxID=2917717 RepID=UPI001FF11C5E|nr:iron-containing alcohol dehydrogenase [Kordiimonas laminariae]